MRRTTAASKPATLVLMDFGADLDHLAMDITRTWPASGTFSAEQREVYKIVLEVEKACIEAYKPGATPKDVRDHVAAVMQAKGLDPRGQLGGFGHGVGLSVHDVPLGGVLKEGMVFAIEPALYYPEKSFGVRIEDTVLITKTGCEVLTKGVPKEIEEVEKLLAGRGQVGKARSRGAPGDPEPAREGPVGPAPRHPRPAFNGPRAEARP